MDTADRLGSAGRHYIIHCPPLPHSTSHVFRHLTVTMVRMAHLSIQADNTSSQIIPVRCFSCGKVIGDKWNAYLELLARDMSEG
jgi:hypothetical protein